MKTTKNYGLKKPETTDFYNIDDMTENMDIIDEKLKDGENHASDKENPHGVTKTQVGLGNVDNTADADKNVKYATSAGSATKDGSGNVIAETYATKSEAENAQTTATEATEE